MAASMQVSIQPRPVIHSSGFAWSTRAFTFSKKSCKLVVPSRFSETSRAPTPLRWQWESVSPGTTVFAPKSTIRVAGPRYFSASASEPTKTILPCVDRDRFGFRLLVVDRVDVAVQEQHIRRLGIHLRGKALCGGKQQDGDDQWDEAVHRASICFSSDYHQNRNQFGATAVRATGYRPKRSSHDG